MANFNDIKQEIDQNVNTNGQQAITGAILNRTLKDMIDEVDEKKQDALIAGSGISIDSENVISTDFDEVQEKLVSGENIRTVNGEPLLGSGDIQIQGTNYSAGNGISIDAGEVISVEPGEIAGTGLDTEIDEHGESRLKVDYNSVQTKLESGVNIKTVNGNSLLGSGDLVISGGNQLWQSGSGTNSLLAPASSAAGATASGNGALNAGNGSSTATGELSTAFGHDSKANGRYSFVAGNNSTAAGDASVALGRSLNTRSEGEVAVGKYNSSHTYSSSSPWNTRFSVGNGTSAINTSNSLEIRDNDKVMVKGIGGYAGSGNDSASNSLQEVVNGKQDILVSGVNIKTINGSSVLGSGDLVISGGSSLSAGDGIDIDSNDAINAKLGNGLQLDSNNNIEIDPSVVATQTDISVYLRSDASGQMQNFLDGTGDTELKIVDGSDEDYVKLGAYETTGEAPHIEIFENGSGDTKFFYDHLERGSQVSIDYPSTSGTLALTSDLVGKQDALTAGNGINIDANDVISSTTFKNGAGTSSIMSVNATNANGSDSVAIGKGCTAGILGNQNGCVSLGYYASAQHSGEVALGKYNKYINTGTDAEKTQFTIGNGVDNGNRSNYFEIKINGDSYLNGIGGYTGTNTSSSTTLQDVINGKQDTLTAGSGISIQNNVISATGGGGGGSLSAGTGIFIANDTINVDTYALSGNGIDNTNDEFNVKLGAGLGFDNNGAVASTTFINDSGYGSLKSVNAMSSGTEGLAAGHQSSAGNYGVALGWIAESHSYATAIGCSNTALGNRSTALGSYSDANGSDSISLGFNTVSDGDFETSLGKFNKSYSGNADTSIDTLFEIGNGTSAPTGRKNVLEIKQNNDTYLYGVGGFDGTNSAAAQTLQDVINNSSSSYSAGNGIDITSGVISVDASDLDGNGLTVDGNGALAVDTTVVATQTDLSGKQDTLTAGSNISISGSTISATDTTYSAGSGLNLNGTTFSVNTNDIQEKLVSGTNIKTVNGNSLLGSGNIVISGGSALGSGQGIDIDSNDNINVKIEQGGGLDFNASDELCIIPENVVAPITGFGAVELNGDDPDNPYLDVNYATLASSLAGTGLQVDSTDGTTLEVDYSTIAPSLVGNGLQVDSTDGTTLEVDSATVASDLAGYFLPIQGGTLSDDSGSTTTELIVDSPSSYATAAITSTDVGTGGSPESISKLTLSDYDSSSNTHTATYGTTGIGVGGNFKLNFPTGRTGSDTIATLSDIQGGSSYSAGSGISIDANNVISNTAPGLWTSGTGNMSLLSPAAKTYGNANGNFAVSAGVDTKAEGTSSFAIGTSSKALGSFSFAGGQSSEVNTQCDWSFAFGQNAKAKSPSSFVFGSYSSVETNSSYSVAIGNNAISSAQNSNAIGLAARAKNTSETAFGPFNNSINSGTTAEKTSYTIGNGTADNARSNLIEAKQNNDIYVVGVGGFDGTNASQALSLQTVINSKQNQLVSGVDVKTINGQSIVGGGNLVISGGSYTAGQAIDITNDAISVDYGNGLGLGTNGELQVEWSEGPTALAGSGLSANTQTGQLDVDFTSVQGKLTAGSGITISGNTISATGGGGASLWTSGTGQNSLVSPGAGASSQGSDASGIGAIVIGDDSNANGDYSFAHGQGSMANGDYSAAFVGSNSTGDYSFAAGNGADAQAESSVAIGSGATTIFDNSDPDNPINADSSVAIGNGAQTYGLNSIAIGDSATARGERSIALSGGEASGLGSFAEGNASHANGLYSTAFAGSTSEANYSFAASTGIANAHYSTALSGAEAFGEGAFAAGQGNQAYGYGAAALGYMAKTYSQANGALNTDPNAGEVALGRYNYSEQGIVFTVGCGYVDNTDPNNPVDVRQNAIAIDSTGKIYLKGLGGYTGTSTSGCTDLVSFLSNL